MENSTDCYEGWSIPQRQSPAAIFIMLMQTAVSLLKALWPFLVLYIFRGKKEEAGERSRFSLLITSFILIGFILLTCIFTFLKYWFYKFYINKDKLVVQSGWLKKKTLTVPLQNIHGVHIEQNLWQRVLQVAQVTIDSAGSEKAEVKIDALSIKKAEQLKALLLSHTNKTPVINVEERLNVKKQANLSTADLLKLSITANHLEAFVIILSLSLNILDNLKDAFQIDSWGIMETYAIKIAGQTMVVISILIVAVALLSIAVSIVRTLMRFYNFSIEDTPQGWRVSYGLVNHQQKIIPANKIQILSWRANWLRRKINFWVLNVQSIGHTTALRKQQILIPVTSLKGVLALTSVYQQSAVFNIDDGLKIQPDYWKRRTLVVGIPVTLILLSAFYFLFGLAALWVLVVLIYFAWFYKKWQKVFRWKINNEGLQIYSGVWGRKYTLLTWKKVQQIQVDQSPYQRSKQLANITFKTAGGKVTLPFLKFDTATYLANLALFYVESRDENWM